jgi:hypothetical protein
MNLNKVLLLYSYCIITDHHHHKLKNDEQYSTECIEVGDGIGDGALTCTCVNRGWSKAIFSSLSLWARDRWLTLNQFGGDTNTTDS